MGHCTHHRARFLPTLIAVAVFHAMAYRSSPASLAAVLPETPQTGMQTKRTTEKGL